MERKSDDSNGNECLRFWSDCPCSIKKTLEHSPKNTSVSRTGIFHQSRDDSVPGTLRSVWSART